MFTKKDRKFPLPAAILFFALASMNAFALGRLTLGVKGGLNSANLRISSESTVSSYQTRNQFVWGGFISYRISGLFSIQVEVLDSPKGSSVIQFTSVGNVVTTLMYRYTEVPILIKLVQGSRSNLMPSVYAGPYWAKLREAKVRTSGQFGDVTETLTDQKSTDFGVIVGASLSYDLGPVAVIGDIRYSLGLVDVDKTSGLAFNHRVFSITAGIGI